MLDKKSTCGLLISIEGIDGSGKSSLATALKEELEKRSARVLLTREPGGTPLGMQMRSFLQQRTCNIHAKAEFLLFAADRAQHMQQVIEPALRQGMLVISDRMADSSLAYQGFGRGLDCALITQVNTWAMNNRVPDITFYIKVDYTTALSRMRSRNEQLTSFEQEKEDFFKRVINGFDTIFAHKSHAVILDGTQSLEAITQQALMYVLQK